MIRWIYWRVRKKGKYRKTIKELLHALFKKGCIFFRISILCTPFKVNLLDYEGEIVYNYTGIHKSLKDDSTYFYNVKLVLNDKAYDFIVSAKEESVHGENRAYG